MNIVFIHGLAGSRRFFSGLEGGLSKILGAKTLSFDLLGFGEQRHAKSNFTAEDHLQFISKAVNTAFGTEPVVLIGHSLGGVLALLWAKQNQERVKGIILLNTPLGETSEEITASIGDLKQSTLGWGYLILKHRFLAHISCNILCRFNLMRLFHFAKPPFVPDEVFEDYHKHTWDSLTETFEHIVIKHPAKPVIESLTQIPILIFAGSNDSALMRVHPTAQNITYAELSGGHFTILEHPEQSLQSIFTFLNGVQR